MIADNSSQANVLSGRVVFPTNFLLKQVFWCSDVVRDDVHVFWLENTLGQVYAVRIRGIGRGPEALLPYFVGIQEISNAEQFVDGLASAWLLPPELSVKMLLNIKVHPAAFLCAEYPGCEVEQIPAALDFFSSLNQEIIEALGSEVTSSAYNVARAWPHQAFRNRLQVLKKYNFLRAELGLGGVRPDLPLLSSAVLNAIDLGTPYERLLAELYGVDRHALRSAAALCRHLLDWEYLPALLILVDAMKPDFRLRVSTSWDDMLFILRWCQRWELAADTVFFQQFAKEFFCDGISGAHRIFRRALPGNAPDFILFHLEDYLRSVQPDGVWCQALPGAFGQIFRKRVQISGSVVAVFLDSLAWSQAQSGLTEQIDTRLKWSPILHSRRRDFGHFTVRELTSATELFQEGLVQKNCIHAHATICFLGQNFIFSLEHREGHQRRTTAHFEIGEDGLLRLLEHSARKNEDPSAAAQADAAELLLFLINSVTRHPRSAQRFLS